MKHDATHAIVSTDGVIYFKQSPFTQTILQWDDYDQLWRKSQFSKEFLQKYLTKIVKIEEAEWNSYLESWL